MEGGVKLFIVSVIIELWSIYLFHLIYLLAVEY